MKRTGVCSMRAVLKYQSIACTDNMYVRQCKFFITLHVPTNDCENTVSIDLGGYKYISLGGQFASKKICK